MWLECEYTYRRQLGEVHEKLEALQQHPMVTITTLICHL